MTTTSFFFSGLAKGRFVQQDVWRSGPEALVLRGAASALTCGAGLALRYIVGVA